MVKHKLLVMVKHIRLVKVKHMIKLKLVMVKHIRLVKQFRQLLVKVSEKPIFQQPNIQLFQQLFLMEYIQYIFLSILMGYILFNIQQHNNQ